MKTLSIAISGHERRCDVDAAELAAWSRALVDDLLLQAAIAAGERGRPDAAPVAVEVKFTVGVDGDGALVLSR